MPQNKKKEEINPQGIRTALLTRFSALGDVAMTVPVVYSACRCYPEIHFVMVTRPSMCSIFVNAPSNLTVVGVDVKVEYAGVTGLRRLAAKLMADYSPDVLLDLHNVLRTRVLGAFLRLKGVPVECVFKPRAKRRALTRRHGKVMLPLTSQRSRYREVFFKAGLPLVARFDGLYDGRGAAPVADFAAITGPKPEGEKWVGIAPFAAHAGKIYPPELMEKVLAHLQADADAGKRLRVFLFGGGDAEVRVLDGWAARYGVATSLAGKKFGFKAELALLNHIDAVVSMDSANMHLSAIAGAPTVSVWGATHPYCGFKAWRQSDADMVQAPIPCRPCSVFGDKTCYRGDMQCLRAIRPEQIYSKLEALVAN
ncbi:MAG: glycosyltransferase family 9 protein [Muribaculaceae bacterium]|nr:glycosyltransferase family 9 protein [Muribaculaceae bacterium]